MTDLRLHKSVSERLQSTKYTIDLNSQFLNEFQARGDRELFILFQHFMWLITRTLFFT